MTSSLPSLTWTQWSFLLASCFIYFSAQSLLPASNPGLQANPNSSTITYSIRTIWLWWAQKLMNPALVIQTKGPKPLLLLGDLILSVSNILALGNHSRHTSYTGCFGLLHCYDTISRMPSSRSTSQGAGCFMSTARSAGVGGSPRHFFSNMHTHPTRILLKCNFWFGRSRVGPTMLPF